MFKGLSTANGTMESRFIHNVTSFFEDFLEMEKELFSREIEGLRYWHFVRFPVFEKILLAKGWIKKLNRREKSSYLEILRVCSGLLKNSLEYKLRWDK